MIEYPAWCEFQSLVRESHYGRVTAGAVAFSAKAALAEQVERAEKAEQERDEALAIIEELKGESARRIDPEEDVHTLDTVMAKKYDEARWVAREAIANSFPVRPSDETIESEYQELAGDFPQPQRPREGGER